MRRPLALTGFTLLGCGLCSLFFGEGVARLLAGLLGAVSVLLLVLGRKFKNDFRIHSLQGCCLAALCAFTLFCATTAYWVTPLASVYNTQTQLTGTVVQEEGEYDTSSYYTVKVQGLYPQSGRTVRLRLRTDGVTSLRPGQIISVQAELKEVPSQSRARLFSDRVYLVATQQKDTDITLLGLQKGIPYYAGIARSYIKNQIGSRLTGDIAAMVTGICLGDTTGLSAGAMDGFNRCGMSHMVAVSGLHTNMVGGILIGLFVFMNAGKRYAKIISVMFVWGFVFVTGAPYSAMRAGIMFTIFAIGTLFYRLPDMLNTLGGAVTLLLLLNPFAAGDIGFLASVGACVGIILLAGRIGTFLLNLMPKRVCKVGLVKGAVNSMGVTAGAFLADVPCSLLGFYNISLAAPFANLLGIPLATAVLLSGLGSVLLGLIPGLDFGAELLLAGSGLCAKGLLAIANGFSRFPFASLPFASVWCYLGFTAVLVGGSVLYLYRRRCKPWVKNLLAAVLVLVMVLTPFVPVYGAGEYEIMVIGEGYDTTLAVTGREGTVVIGCASPYRVQKVLGSRGINRIDCLILPSRLSYHQDLSELLGYLSVEQVITTPLTQTRGLLAGLEGTLQTLSFQNTVTMGGIAVRGIMDFSAFEVTVKNVRILYADSEVPTEKNYHYLIYNAGLNQNQGTVIEENGQTVTAGQTVMIQVNQNRTKLFQPRFVYG